MSKKNKAKHRLYYPQPIDCTTIEINDSGQVHKINQVLRLNKGGVLQLFNGDGFDYLFEIVTSSRKTIVLKQLEKKKNSLIGDPHQGERKKITLAVCLIKSEPMKWMLQKSQELGANEIVPIISERVVAIERSKENFQTKINRYHQILIQAAEQSGAIKPATLKPIVDLESFISETAAIKNKFVLSTQSVNYDYERLRNEDCLVLIGPEGDFSDQEYRTLKQAKFIDLSLGDQILKVETAVVSVLSIFNYLNLSAGK